MVGNWIGVEVVKTRLGPCHRECYLQHLYETGIDYYSGYARLLIERGYLRAKNKKEFHGFKQTTVVHGEGDDKKEFHELHGLEKILAEHAELIFSHYPAYSGFGTEAKNEQRDGTEDISV